MGRTEVEQLKKAGKLAGQLRNRHFDGGCLEVSMTALGAGCDLDSTLNRKKIILGLNLSTQEYLTAYGLTPVAISEANSSDITEFEVEEFINKPASVFANCSVPAPKGLIKGVLVELYPKDENTIGHAVAVLHRDNLPRGDRQIMKTNNTHLLIDLASEGVIGQTDAQTLAEGINIARKIGLIPTIYFLVKQTI